MAAEADTKLRVRKAHPKTRHEPTLSNGNFTLVSVSVKSVLRLRNQAWARFWRTCSQIDVCRWLGRCPSASASDCGAGRRSAGAAAASSRTGFPSSALEGLQMAVGGPHLELGIPGRVDLQQRVVAAVAKIEAGNGLRVAAIEALGYAQDRRERAHGLAQRRRQPRVLFVRSLRRASTMIAGDERHDFDLVRVEAAEIAIPDQIVRMPMMPLVADVRADVVKQRRELEPLPLAIGQAVHRPRLIEDRQRQPHDLLRMFRVVVAPLGKFK